MKFSGLYSFFHLFLFLGVAAEDGGQWSKSKSPTFSPAPSKATKSKGPTFSPAPSKANNKSRNSKGPTFSPAPSKAKKSKGPTFSPAPSKAKKSKGPTFSPAPSKAKNSKEGPAPSKALKTEKSKGPTLSPAPSYSPAPSKAGQTIALQDEYAAITSSDSLFLKVSSPTVSPAVQGPHF